MCYMENPASINGKPYGYVPAPKAGTEGKNRSSDIIHVEW